MHITFGAIIVDGKGKIGGQLVQSSYGGKQLRNIVQPLKNPTAEQSINRVRWAYTVKQWRVLTNENRQSYIDAAPPGVSGFEFFTTINMPRIVQQLEILPNYITPIPFPTDQGLIKTYGVWDPPPAFFQLSFFNFGLRSPYPYAGWTPAFLWTGWVHPSISSFPKLDKSFDTSYTTFAAVQYTLNFITGVSENINPPAADYKMKYQERWINDTTGQLYIGATYEVSAANFGPTNSSYAIGYSDILRSFGGSPGNYWLILDIQDTLSPINDDWELYAFCSEWVSDSGVALDSYRTQVIPATAFTKTSADTYTISFSSDPEHGPAPSQPGYWSSLGVGWRNTITGELSIDYDIIMEAANS